jgi:hypothetical protein
LGGQDEDCVSYRRDRAFVAGRQGEKESLANKLSCMGL